MLLNEIAQFRELIVALDGIRCEKSPSLDALGAFVKLMHGAGDGAT